MHLKSFVAVITLVSVAGCHDRTGVEWLDPFIVRDYEDRVDLTNALDEARAPSARRYSYCDYGCDHVCTDFPEVTIYRNLDKEYRKKMSELRKRAERSGLIFEVQPSGIVYDRRVHPELAAEEVAPAKLTCLQRQREHIERIETLLDRLSQNDD